VVRDAPTISRAGVIQGEGVGGVTPYKPVRGSSHREKQGEVMRIKGWELKLTWEDGTENEVSNYVPEQTARAIENFIDYWEEKYNDDEPKEDEGEV